MQMQCLVIETDVCWQNRLRNLLEDQTGVQITIVDNLHHAALYIRNNHPSLIYIRCSDPKLPYDRVLKIIQRGNLRSLIIPMVSKITEEVLSSLLHLPNIVDVLTDEANPGRIEDAFQKARQRFRNTNDKSKYYRGFVGFVGVTPTLRERKLINQAQLGILHNRSVRLAIEYWRKNPGSQLCMVTLNTNDTFSSRMDEHIEYWEEFDFKPWEIAVFEAQNYYSHYWADPIIDGLMPSVIPVLFRQGTDEFEILEPKEEMELLIKIGRLFKQGDVSNTLRSMGIAFRTENSLNKKGYEEIVKGMEKQMEEVDKQYPHLTRPDEDHGSKDIFTELEEKKDDQSWKRMAYTSKSRY